MVKVRKECVIANVLIMHPSTEEAISPLNALIFQKKVLNK
jgi:hypothetical protein